MNMESRFFSRTVQLEMLERESERRMNFEEFFPLKGKKETMCLFEQNSSLGTFSLVPIFFLPVIICTPTLATSQSNFFSRTDFHQHQGLLELDLPEVTAL